MDVRILDDRPGLEENRQIVQQVFAPNSGDRRAGIRICSDWCREAGPPWLCILPSPLKATRRDHHRYPLGALMASVCCLKRKG